MTTTRHSFTSIATALAMAAALIAAMGPRVEAEESKSEEFTLTITASCEDPAADPLEWDPHWYAEDIEADKSTEFASWDDGEEGEDDPYAATIVFPLDLDDLPEVIDGEILIGWKGYDECLGGHLEPGGTVEVTFAISEGAKESLEATTQCPPTPKCPALRKLEDPGDPQDIWFRIEVNGPVTATVGLTVTWTP